MSDEPVAESGESSASETDGAQQPVLRVERGRPDDVEVAALTAALVGIAAASSGDGGERPERMSMWGDPGSALRYPGGRRPMRPGPNAWRASALPM
ncbi:Acyl-CoA carboxylase epsilon subunit [Actinopolyspora lacussalsi subsp. righensis]|uniref:Acyl-CoA carboxylase epsilon subunit n=1 Tax=Actinopolyspora righensis TaxID=995060 RepID=A0A1I6YDX1_9ACTN|nr:acyl-CoA carboxylase subunit epsilon [Actinopolyspora righensis]SFT48602.1 Acyl-CoA carboxylase epsilon subunit [Actinopolyspora righensis]